MISFSTVKRLVIEIEDHQKETFIRQEYEYGDVYEFDWSEVPINIRGECFKKYQMAVFTVAKSNYRFAMLLRHMTYQHFSNHSLYVLVYIN